NKEVVIPSVARNPLLNRFLVAALGMTSLLNQKTLYDAFVVGSIRQQPNFLLHLLMQYCAKSTVFMFFCLRQMGKKLILLRAYNNFNMVP
ncbi:MAG: hypothetical protein ACRENG_34105, partial [bacterium]